MGCKVVHKVLKICPSPPLSMTMVLKKQQFKKYTYSTRHLSIPIKTKYKHVYPILALMLTSSLELLLMNIIDKFLKISTLLSN